MKTIKICAFGDSVMKGTILESLNPLQYTLPPNIFTDIAAQKLGIQINNYARFGSTLATGEKILLRHIAAIPQYDYILLKFGGNDCDYHWDAIAAEPQRVHHPFAPLTEFMLKYEKLVNKIRLLGSSPIILSLTPVDSQKYFRHITRDLSESGRQNVLEWLGGTPNFISEWHEMYNIKVMELAGKLGVPIIDITSPFYSKPAYGEMLCEDGIHPNLEGQKLLTSALCDGLGNILSSAKPVSGISPVIC